MQIKYLNKSLFSRLQQFKSIIFTLIFIFGFFRPFIVDAYLIPSGSMEDTLLVGDRVLVSKFMYGFKIPGTDIKVFDFHKPARGDVFVFIPPHERKLHFIKRIVAIEGDTVYTNGKKLYVNGKLVDEQRYAKHLNYNPYRQDFPPFRNTKVIPKDKIGNDFALTHKQFKQKFPDGKPFTVPEGTVFAMGDNRDQSSDSRTWGPVDVNDIKGQAFMILWSYQNNTKKYWEIWRYVNNFRLNRFAKLIR